MCLHGRTRSLLSGHAPFTEHFGVYQGAKPNIYHDPTTNIKPSVHYPPKHSRVHYLGHRFSIHRQADPPTHKHTRTNTHTGTTKTPLPHMREVTKGRSEYI